MAIDLTPNGVPGSSYDDFGLKSSSTTVTLAGVTAGGFNGTLNVKRVIDPFSDLGPSGRPTGLYSFSNQITMELVGQQGIVSNGSLTITGDANEALTSQLGTTTLGTITASNPVTVALTGLAGTTTLGTLTLAYEWNETLTAVEGTSGLGGLIVGNVLFSNVGTTSLGSLSLSTETNETLTGATSTGVVGSVTPLTDHVLTLTGHAGTTSLGTVTPVVPDVGRAVYSDLSPMGTPGFIYTFVAGSAVTTELTGVVGTTAVAEFNAWTVQQEVDGIAATATAAAVTTTQGATIALTGNVGTAALGTILAPETVALTGLSATGLLGNVSAQALDVSAPINGVQASGDLGSLTLSIDSTVSIAAVVGTGVVGELFPSVAVILTGVQGATFVGSLISQVVDPGTPIENPDATFVLSNYEIDAVSGFRVYPGDLLKRWDGQYVRQASNDPRHMQEFVKSRGNHPQRGPQSPERDDEFT